MALQQVDNLAALAAAWRADPLFLKPQLQAWLRKEAAAALDRLWPQLLGQALTRGSHGMKGSVAAAHQLC